MENQNIKDGKCLVENNLRDSAMQLGLPTPIVNWQIEFFRGTTIYTALIFVGEKHKRMTFFEQELVALNETKEPNDSEKRLYETLVK